MSIEENVQRVKDFFAAMGSGDKQRLLSLVAEDIEWIIPGEHWPLAGTHRGHAGLAAVLKKASEEVETTYPEAPEFIAQGDRVLVVGVATGENQGHEIEKWLCSTVENRIFVSNVADKPKAMADLSELYASK